MKKAVTRVINEKLKFESSKSSERLGKPINISELKSNKKLIIKSEMAQDRDTSVERRRIQDLVEQALKLNNNLELNDYKPHLSDFNKYAMNMFENENIFKERKKHLANQKGDRPKRSKVMEFNAKRKNVRSPPDQEKVT